MYLILFILSLSLIAHIVSFFAQARLRQQLKEIVADRDSLLIDPIFGCLNRTGLERQWPRVRDSHGLLFFDLDNFKAYNTNHGYEGTNSRVKRALASSVRANETYAGRWFSGDELVILAPKTALIHIANRAKAAFEAEGITFTGGISHGYGLYDLSAVVTEASTAVQEAKARNERNAIIIT